MAWDVLFFRVAVLLQRLAPGDLVVGCFSRARPDVRGLSPSVPACVLESGIKWRS